MLKILIDNSLPNLEIFSSEFKVSLYQDELSLKNKIQNQDILLCRSTLKVDANLLRNSSIRCVATASSGSDHVDETYLSQQNITLFDAKGCNAHAVADYVSSSVAWLLKHSTLSKGQAGIIGMGYVGAQVSKRLTQLGFKVLHYDPLLALLNPNFNSCEWDELSTCNLISVHANLHETAPFPSHFLLNSSFFANLQSNTVILNAARGGIINEKDLLQFKNKIIYCTDVYQNEPKINSDIVNFATLCTPHIAGHSIEAKSNAVIMLAQKLYSHFQLKTSPSLSLAQPIFVPMLEEESLINYFLRLYNPLIETQQLKQATDKTLAFLSLRKAHHFRHDWSNPSI